MMGSVTEDKPGLVLLAGNSNPDLARLIADRLGIRLAECSVFNKPNKETHVDIRQSIRNKHVFIFQTGTKDVNNHVMELLILIYTCKTSSAKKITVVLPYLPYSKQCKMWRRSAIAGKLLAEMICKAGAHHVITMDLYKKEIQGFFSVPVDNLRASPFLLQYIKENIADYKNAVIVARHPGVMNKATSYAERLRLVDVNGLGIAVVHGEQKAESEVDGRSSPPPVRPQEYFFSPLEVVPAQAAKEKPPLTIVGDVGGKIAIMVDDLIDDVSSFVAAADMLRQRGAYKIYLIATHGLLSGDAPQQLTDSAINEVIVTNTVPHEVQKMQCHKIKTVDVSLMLSESIRRIYHDESMSHLFRDITIDD